MKKIIALLIIMFFSGCNTENCDHINNMKFNSYSEAKQYVETFDFQHSEEENLQRSSWISKANYYSCDGLVGYFTYETKKGKKFIYRNLPIEVWHSFKDSNSPGRFYNDNIKGRFLLILDK